MDIEEAQKELEKMIEKEEAKGKVEVTPKEIDGKQFKLVEEI